MDEFFSECLIGGATTSVMSVVCNVERKTLAVGSKMMCVQATRSCIALVARSRVL